MSSTERLPPIQQDPDTQEKERLECLRWLALLTNDPAFLLAWGAAELERQMRELEPSDPDEPAPF